jgi:cysteine desulfurase family protein
MMPRRIYLDNAATSWPKPDSVYDAVDDYQRRLGAPAGRGAYREALEIERRLEQTRSDLASLIGATSPQQIIFTYSGTDALTLALLGLLRSGDHVVTSATEHNAVLRPLRHLEKEGRIQVTRIAPNAEGVVPTDAILDGLRAETRLVALIHVSNVTGAVQPVEEVALRLRQHQALLLVDAAQSVGHLPLNVTQIGCDLLAAPGHKGLFGPLGTGFLYVAPGRERDLRPVRLGGTGTQSDQDEAPDELPFRFEAGNLNVPGLVGLGAGIRYVLERGVTAIAEHEQQLRQQLLAQLTDMPGAIVYGPRQSGVGGVVSLNLNGYEPQELAALLDQVASIQVRAGFHCAPRIHDALGTRTRGGTVRISPGALNTEEDLAVLASTLQQLSLESNS